MTVPRYWSNRYISKRAQIVSLCYVLVLLLIACVAVPFIPSMETKVLVLVALMANCVIGRLLIVKCIDDCCWIDKRDTENGAPPTTLVEMNAGPSSQGNNPANSSGINSTVGIIEVLEDPPPYVDPPSYDEIPKSDGILL